MTMLKDDLQAQQNCRQLAEVMALVKKTQLTSVHLSEWCTQLEGGFSIAIKDQKDGEVQLVKVDLKNEDFELFIKECQNALTLYHSKKQELDNEPKSDRANDLLKSRKELRNVFGGVSESTIDRFFKYLSEKNIPFHKEALHGRSYLYKANEMKRLYLEYLKLTRQDAKSF